MVFKSTPSTAIHACRVPPVKARGKPEANPNRATVPIRLLAKEYKVREIFSEETNQNSLVYNKILWFSPHCS